VPIEMVNFHLVAETISENGTPSRSWRDCKTGK
jgi:hypothetical protein